MMRLEYLVPIWACGWLLTYCAVNAKFAYIGASPPKLCGFVHNTARGNLGFSMLFALAPPAWIITPFFTGFYEHGMQFGTRQRDCGDDTTDHYP